MHKSSSRQPAGKRGSSTRSTVSSHPATGIYPSDVSTITDTTSSFSFRFKSRIGAQNDEDFDSTEEYEVEFPPVELKLPDHPPHPPPHHHHHHHRRRRSRHPSKCEEEPNNEGVYTELPSGSQYSLHSRSTHTYQSSYNSQQRFQSLGNMFTSIISFFQGNPNMTKVLFGIVLCYVVVCNLEILIPKLISMIVRIVYPWTRYMAVILEQFFTNIANMFTRMDAMIYATYCEFAAKYCRSRRLMCDVTCSFVDHVLSQSRPHLAPIPQN